MQLSPSQSSALQTIAEWYNKVSKSKDALAEKPFFYLAGYAGTGKTTLVSQFRQDISGHVCYAAYTGKAAMQMRKQGVGAQTIHSLIYTPETNPKGETVFVLNKRYSDLVGARLLVLDECSMVDKTMGTDLLSFQVPILNLGDPGQLPPIKGQGFFTSRKPDVMLTEVHRQALDSPILRVATEVREGRPLKKADESGLIVYPIGQWPDDDLISHEQTLTGMNKVRNTLNKQARELLGFKSQYPQKGDRLVCLRNNRAKGLYNGLIVEALSNPEDFGTALILDIETEMGREVYDVHVLKDCFDNPETVKELPYEERKYYDEFDWGYALTVHKAQGSQWDSVLIVDDGFLRWDQTQRRRWLYTGITRAAEELKIVRTKR